MEVINPVYVLRNFVRFDVNLLKVLESIYANGGITGAAKALHLTQPAITHSLNRLREIFDDPLFVRQGNRMVPTFKTQALMPKIQFHLSGLRAAVEAVEEFDPAQVDAVFTVGFRDVLESVMLPVLVRHITSQAPKVKLISRRVQREDVDRQLVSGAIDLVIDRSTHTDSRINSAFLAHETMVVVLRAGHPLADELRTRDFLAAKHVSVVSQGGTDPLDQLLAEGGKAREIGMVCQHYFSACQVVAGSDWLLTAPAGFANAMSALLPVVVRPLPIRLKPLRIEMYWHAALEEDPGQRWLRGLVTEAYHQQL
jgi:DNA-binding transcriptional LysR family regulator